MILYSQTVNKFKFHFHSEIALLTSKQAKQAISVPACSLMMRLAHLKLVRARH